MAILRNKSLKFAVVAAVVLFVSGPCPTVAQTKNSCVDCHSMLPAPQGITQETFSHDIHAQKGLTCVSCHGGDASADDPDKAMSVKAGWKGKIDRRQIPQLCGS